MTLVLVANIILAALVFAVILTVAMWAINGSRHEGQPVTVARRRHWLRPTISLRREPARSGRRVRPFAS
jgi:hypothetical protein